MSGENLERALEAWGRSYDGLSEDEVEGRVRAFALLVRGISRRGAVSPVEFGRELQINTSKAREIFEGLAGLGVQLDATGNVVGAALTVRETSHRVLLGGRELYAWCALDTLFIPGLLGDAAMVRSTCPVSGEEVRLSVSPSGVDSCEPTGAALSVVLPGVGAFPARTGPASPT
jgi:alkylmercury lyase